MHKNKIFLLGPVLLLLAFASTAKAGRSLDPSAPEQHVVFAVGARTQVELKHQFGDDFALINIRRPKMDLIQELERQKGPFLVGVERLGLRKDVLSVRIHLSSPETMVTQRLLNNPRSVLLSFSLSNERPMPNPWDLVAPMSRVYKMPPPPVTLPKMSDKNPCQNVKGTYMLMRHARNGEFVDIYTARAVLREAKDDLCKNFVKGLLAEVALKHNDDVYPFERWAFEMQHIQPWAGFQLQQQRLLLVASAILIRRELYPETHLLLKRLDQLGDYGLAPFARIARAHLYFAEGAIEDTLEIVYPLTTGQADPASWHFTAYHIYLSVSAQSGNIKGALEAALRAEAHLPLSPKRKADLWLYGGEMAMELKEYDHAQTLFRRATEEGTEWQKALALMRLGDILVHLSGEEGMIVASQRQWRKAKRNLRKPWVRQMLRLREALATPPRPGHDPARTINDLYAVSLTRELKAEAAFALAHIALIRGNPPKALSLAKHLLEIMPEQGEWPIVDEIVKSAVNGYFERLSRKGSWLDIIREYNLGLKEYQNYLNGNTMYVVARAHAEIGLHLRASELFLDVLSAQYEQLDLRQATHSLWESYVALEDHHRADVVARYIRTRYPGAPMLWQYRFQEAIDLVRTRKPKEGMKVLQSVMKKIPAGDAHDRANLVRAEALAHLEQPGKALKLFESTMKAPALDPLNVKRVGVHVLSECARNCAPKELRHLVDLALKHPDKLPMNQRVRYLLAKRGIQVPEDEKQEPEAEAPAEGTKSEATSSESPDEKVEPGPETIWDQLKTTQKKLDYLNEKEPSLGDPEKELKAIDRAEENGTNTKQETGANQ
jgi:hypothetical protein